MLVMLVVAGVLAWAIHTNCLQRTGNRDQAMGWAVGAFVLTAINIVLGILLAIVYLIFVSSVPQAKKTCEACGKENEPTAVVCQYCGNAFAKPEPKRVTMCPQCNRVFSDDSRFCPKCGVGLEQRECEDTATKPQGAVILGPCPVCAAKNLPHRAECWKCGHKFGETKEQA